MYQSETEHYVCTCNKNYKTKGHFKRHLQNEHNWVFQVAEGTSASQDHIAIWRSSFMKLAWLLRDTEDAYKLCDADRNFRNAKFEIMCADVANHTNYKLWF